MQLLHTTDLALRALLFLAAGEGTPTSTSAIAEALSVSSEHLAKAVKELTRSGFLVSTRGARGGVALARPPSRIVIGEVVRHFEAGRGPVVCLHPASEAGCVLASGCGLQGALRDAQEAFFRHLDDITVAALLPATTSLVRLHRRRPSLENVHASQHQASVAAAGRRRREPRRLP